jgi:methionyl-tRNA synthetase
VEKAVSRQWPKELDAVHLRSALGEAMRLASEVNRYLDQTAPWTAIKTDRQAAARAVYTALRAIDSLKILLAPFLPFTSQRLHGFFGYEGQLLASRAPRRSPMRSANTWRCATTRKKLPVAGNPRSLSPDATQPASPLFKKLDASIVAEERARLGTPATK